MKSLWMTLSFLLFSFSAQATDLCPLNEPAIELAKSYILNLDITWNDQTLTNNDYEEIFELLEWDGLSFVAEFDSETIGQEYFFKLKCDGTWDLEPIDFN